MYSIQLTGNEGTKITLFFSTNLAVTQNSGGVRVLDGLHNNGGWHVRESYDEVITLIRNAVHPKSCNFGPG